LNVEASDTKEANRVSASPPSDDAAPGSSLATASPSRAVAGTGGQAIGMTHLTAIPQTDEVSAARREAAQEGFQTVRLRSQGALETTFAPQVGMTCCSLRHGEVELLGERFGLAAYADGGVTMGMSLMHPWADRLSCWDYTACGTTVRLPLSPLLHTDRWGLPVNGVQSCGAWSLEATGSGPDCAWLEATLPFDSPRQLELFPFPHRVHLRAEVAGSSLRIAILIEATGGTRVPACFAYRLYLRREHSRGGATLVLPTRRRLVTDERLLPTGATESLEMGAFTLGVDELHEVFLLGADRRVTVASDARRMTIESLSGFPFAQVRSVASEPHVMVEALTAAPDALSRDVFPVATPGHPYRAALCLSVDELSCHRARVAA
jgi:aldose 1-epimerase